MATISIDIPNQVLGRVSDAIAAEYNYDQQRDGTKAQFAKKVIIDFIKRVVKDYEGNIAAKSARNSSESDIDSNIQIT